ncbi:hypothetical protein C4D60_Mb06t37550 [Musa balbisiana]|uniref:Fungal lipase-type domain-containing protein n=1 Tax=Musa balbisiana TaxID=52838 RepID=A0A4S8IUV6_MUSBA|nr:hypothetical protein C4D60_Mb06t37550 [Musa balbisiana]
MPIGSAMVTAPRHVSPVRNPLRHRPSSPLNPLAARFHSAAHIHATTATAITTVVSTRTHLSNLDRLLQKKQPVAPPPPPQPAPDPVVEDDRDPRDSPFSFSVLHRTGSSLLNALNLPSALFLPSSSTQQAEEISPRSLTHLRRLLSNSNRQSPRGIIAPRWHQYHGAADWDGLLDPLDHDLRRELIRYGEFAQATYHAFHSNPTAAPPDRPRAVVLPDRSYRVTCNLFATASVELPPWVDTVAPWMMTATPTSWVGYVAVCDNEREIQRMGRRDIVIALRGTSTCLEWAENFRTWLVPIDEEEQEAEEEESSEGEQTEKPRGAVPKVECGFRSLFKTAGPDAPSLSSMVAEEVRRLMEQYAGEELSITVVGHSLGAALAVLVADELAASVSPHVPTAVFSFGGPRVGNQAFADRVERRAVKVLRVVNAHDLVTRVPWVLPARADGYAHVGRELRVDNRMSPYLRPDADAACCHDLEAYLHLVDGFMATNCPFRSDAKRSLARLLSQQGTNVKELYVSKARDLRLRPAGSFARCNSGQLPSPSSTC